MSDKSDYALFKEYVRDIVRDELAKVDQEKRDQENATNTEIEKRVKKYE